MRLLRVTFEGRRNPIQLDSVPVVVGFCNRSRSGTCTYIVQHSCYHHATNFCHTKLTSHQLTNQNPQAIYFCHVVKQQRHVLAIEGKITGSKPRDHFLYGWAFSLLRPSRCTCLVLQNNVRTPRHLDASLLTGTTKLQVQQSARKLIK